MKFFTMQLINQHVSIRSLRTLTLLLCFVLLAGYSARGQTGSGPNQVNASICEGEVYVFGGIEYSISGNYSHTFTGADGQDSTVMLMLTVYPVFQQIYDITLCFGESMIINGVTYSNAGTFFDSLSNQYGCDSIIQYNIVIESQLAPVIQTSADSFCTGGSVLLDAGPGYTSYAWSNGSNAQQISVSEGGVYTVTVSLGNCSASASTIVTELLCPPLSAEFSVSDTIGCAPHAVHFQYTSGTGNLQYQWNFGNGIFSQQSGQSIVFGVAGIYPVTLEVSDGLQTVMYSQQVHVYAPPDVVITALVSDQCNLQEISFSAAVDGDFPAQTWFWETGDGSNSSSEAFTHLYQQAGIFNVAVSITDLHGCSLFEITTLEVTANQNNEPAEEEVVLCAGDFYNGTLVINDTIIEEIYTDGQGCDSLVIVHITAKPTFSFAIDTTICEGSYLVVANTLLSDQGTYNLTQTNVFGCEDQYSVNLQVTATVETLLEPVVCAGDTFIFDGSLFYEGNPSGTIVLQAASGCDSLVHVQVQFETQELPLLISGAPDTAVCSNVTLTLDAGSGGLSYLWSDGSNQQTLQVTETGFYMVTVTYQDACPAEGHLLVIVQQPPSYVPDAGVSFSVCGTQATLNAAPLPPGISGFWSGPPQVLIQSPLSINTVVTGLQEGDNPFTWTVSATPGVCQAYAQDEVTVSAYVRDDDQLAQAGDDQLFCEQPSSVQLSASGNFPSDDSGLWQFVQTIPGASISNVNDPAAQITGVDNDGTIILEWQLSNAACGTYSRDTMQVLVGTSHLPFADGGSDLLSCGRDTVLLPVQRVSGATGQWTVEVGEATVTMHDQFAELHDYSTGTLTLSWTLSTVDCPSFSSDTISVVLPPGPLQANYQQYFVEDNEQLNGIEPLANDDLPAYPGNYVLSIISEPELGVLLDQGNNVFAYIPPAGLDVTVSFVYLVCNDLCIDWCSSGTVALTPFSILPPRPDPPITPPANVITPNGDGVGDALVVPNFGDIMGRIKLTVVNRWGDVVYTQYPYDNNWQGTNMSGQPLPEGTYYFLMQLASGGQEALDEGGVVKGTVTILR